MKLNFLIYFWVGSFLSLQAQTILFSEDFESGTLPTGWSRQQAIGSTGWQVGIYTSLSSTNFQIPPHSNFAVSNDDACNCDMSNDLLISPAIDLSAASMPQLTFSTFINGSYNSKGSILVSTDGTTWNTLQDIATNPAWKTYQVNLMQYAGASTVYLAFKHDDNGNYASGVAIDDVVVFEPAFVGNTILFEGFDACTLPSGWGTIEHLGGVGFEFGTPSALSGNTVAIPPHSGCVAAINDAKHDGVNGTPNNVDDFLHTPSLDLSNYGSVFLEFDTWVASDRRFYMDVVVSTDSINWNYVKGIYSIDGWRSFQIDLTNWAGLPKVYIGFRARDFNFTYDQGGGAIDNIHIYEPPTHDLELNHVFPYQYMAVGKSPVKGKIKNLGSDVINSIDIHWQVDNGTINSETLTSLTYDPLSSNDFLFSDSIGIYTTGTHTLKIWISAPNGSPDLNLSNDSITKTIEVLPYLPKKRVVLEEHTATWCTSCPEGLDSTIAFSDRNPDLIVTAIHNGDIMSYTDGNIVAGGMGLRGLPSLTIDRRQSPSTQSLWFSPYNNLEAPYQEHRDLIEPIEITFLQKAYDTLTHELTVEVNAEFFVAYPHDDLRLNVMITEDSVSNEFDANYNQANANTFPYYHRHVARANLDGAWGTQGSLPTSVAVGNYSKLFTWTVPDSFNLDQLEIIGLVQRHSTDRYNRAILNANKIGFNENLSPTSTQAIQLLTSPNINIYPNPFSDNLTVAFNLATTANVSIEIVDMIGQQVGFWQNKTTPAGRQFVTMRPHLSTSLVQGVYFLTIQLGEELFTQEIIYQN